MWDWKPAKMVLERSGIAAELAIAGRQGFQRVYDLPERVIPREWLDAPVPTEDETLRALALLAVRGARRAHRGGDPRALAARRAARRACTITSIALVAEGRLREVAVDDGGAPFYVAAGRRSSTVPRAPPVLLCPFDNLVWDRPLLRAAVRLPTT